MNVSFNEEQGQVRQREVSFLVKTVYSLGLAQDERSAQMVLLYILGIAVVGIIVVYFFFLSDGGSRTITPAEQQQIERMMRQGR